MHAQHAVDKAHAADSYGRHNTYRCNTLHGEQAARGCRASISGPCLAAPPPDEFATATTMGLVVNNISTMLFMVRAGARACSLQLLSRRPALPGAHVHTCVH